MANGPIYVMGPYQKVSRKLRASQVTELKLTSMDGIVQLVDGG
jgi:hypothetical protein